MYVTSKSYDLIIVNFNAVLTSTLTHHSLQKLPVSNFFFFLQQKNQSFDNNIVVIVLPRSRYTQQNMFVVPLTP